MAVEIKELHVKTSIRGGSANRENAPMNKALKEEMERYCKRIIQDLLDRPKER